MATNPVGKGTKTIGINMPEEMANDFIERAQNMQLSTGKYLKIVLKKWIDSGETLTLSEK